jgi:hypothetical protein
MNNNKNIYIIKDKSDNQNELFLGWVHNDLTGTIHFYSHDNDLLCLTKPQLTNAEADFLISKYVDELCMPFELKIKGLILNDFESLEIFSEQNSTIKKSTCTNLEIRSSIKKLLKNAKKNKIN